MIERSASNIAGQRFDLIVVGGGIHGVCVALEAAQRGVQPLLIEAGDVGSATSHNSFRILHGGLRYLQNLDLARFFESVRERRWFARTMPELVRPLPCLLPLYGRGLKRRSLFGPAVMLNDALACRRNAGVAPEARLPSGGILTRKQTLARVPTVEARGLQGAGLWYDATLRSPSRALMRLLRWMAALGGAAVNYTEACELIWQRQMVRGVRARDRTSGEYCEFEAPAVVNAAGPWAHEFARTCDSAMGPHTLSYPSLAFNVVLDQPPPANEALAIETVGPNRQIYFARPFGDRTLLGTAHAPYAKEDTTPDVTAEHIQRFIGEVNAAMPKLRLSADAVDQVMAGLLPATEPGGTKLTDRPTIYDHARHGGPRGLVSVSGIKYTTARATAERTVKHLVGNRLSGNKSAGERPSERIAQPATPSWPVSLLDPTEAIGASESAFNATVDRLYNEEAARTADDIVDRRTEWGNDPRHRETLRRRVETRLMGKTAHGEFIYT